HHPEVAPRLGEHRPRADVGYEEAIRRIDPAVLARQDRVEARALGRVLDRHRAGETGDRRAVRRVRKRIDALDRLAADVEEAKDRSARRRDGEGRPDRDDDERSDCEHEHPAAARRLAQARPHGPDEIGLRREGEQPPDLAQVALELSHTSPSAGRARGTSATSPYPACSRAPRPSRSRRERGRIGTLSSYTAY